MTTPPTLRGIDALGPWLAERDVGRALLITGEGRRFVDRVHLDGVHLEVFDGAVVHVPREVVDRAAEALDRADAEAIVTLGGGSATGLGKALRRSRPDLPFVAIPTTYAGSEQTAIYGVREDGAKKTGRDERVRPDAVVHDPSLFVGMPRGLSVKSLLNALAHPISALSTGALEGSDRRAALKAVEQVVWALDQLLEAPASKGARADGLRGATLAARVLDRAELGAHHRHAHDLGGRFGLEHAALHALLLPHSVLAIARDDRALYDEIAEAAGYVDLPATLYDMLRRVGASRSLLELGVDADADVSEALEDARLGRRPSVRVDRDESGASRHGPPLAEARRVVLALHGRGANADRMLRTARELVGHDPTVAIVAPQATDNRWYPRSYRASLAEHGADLEDALARAGEALDRVLAAVPAERVFVVGFSQGACLAAELVARRGTPLGGLVALAGARVGPSEEQPPIAGPLEGTRALFGVSEDDEWLELADVRRTAAAFEAAGAEVELVVNPGAAHHLSGRQRVLAQELLRGVRLRDGQRGFGNAHHGEALEGALPLDQNTPRRAPYELYPEAINGTGFTARRRDNLRTWFYRVRPSAQHTPFTPLPHPTLTADWAELPAPVNLVSHRARAFPDEPTDFVDGLATYGGAGDPALRRGFAVHLYVANRSMEERSFTNADGDLLILPQEGALTILTELGVLDVPPGHLAIVPKGLRFSVLLQGGRARGYVAEVYGRHFELPERGPVGANGLTDERHFRAPTPWFEDRLAPAFRMTTKMDNALYDATQDYSPYDVVAWHGDYVPYVYDLGDFSPVGNTRFDHPDPSIYTVLSAPMDETGANALDLVFFPPRWDVTEHTFRPPYFHRNGTTEINGILSDPTLSADGPFSPGGIFLTPAMTPHGVMAKAVHRAFERSDEAADRPSRVHDESRWFQFETTLPLRLTRWAREATERDTDWPLVWGSYRARFTPPG